MPGIPDRLVSVCPLAERLDPAAPQAEPGLRRASAFQPVEPLWQRLPRRDADGRRLADFMMLIPGLKRRNDHEIRARLAAIQCVLEGYGEVIAFVELNLRINTLWVSVLARPGLCLEIPVAIQAAVPEALLIGQRPDR
ncbi:hypothetical protein TVNIR_0075 [Thioalkalivibrio nitratireducens DSM 14787]|uniref:Uncharacterized protein n=1 Tax=Thioalkalivibrio nitratireducens (strain DSM 14787 / UNIQEM 213 / ALEN2) TaxID=1255043 RepID=L0DS03_THIND|nr:hypothetical protein TVNIR_0075 [Thioalkalivibrio nitratireducens DSM 14787]